MRFSHLHSVNTLAQFWASFPMPQRNRLTQNRRRFGALLTLMWTVVLPAAANHTIPVRRSDFTVTQAYSGLFFFHVVCLNDAGQFGDDSVCKVEGDVSTGYPPVPNAVARGIMGCEPLFDGATFDWYFNAPSTATFPPGKISGEAFVQHLASCGQLAAAISALSDAERARYYADCAKVTHHVLEHCFLIAKVDWGYILGYAFFEPVERQSRSPRSAIKLPPNLVCIESDQEAHPLSECPGFSPEEIDDSAFPAKSPRARDHNPPPS